MTVGVFTRWSWSVLLIGAYCWLNILSWALCIAEKSGKLLLPRI